MAKKPNILLIISDDHAAPALSCYGSTAIQTPNLDEIAREGVRFDRALVVNSLCTPSRATYLTGTYSHVNQVTTLDTPIDASQPTFVSCLKEAGYKTAFFGKWHMGHGPGHDPQGFDYWEVFYDQGTYWDPVMRTINGDQKVEGYITDTLTDRAMAWLDTVTDDESWCLLLWHKAPHRPWIPHPRHLDEFLEPIDIPATFNDDLRGRGTPAHHATMKVANDLADVDLKLDPPQDLSYEEMGQWKYQRYMQDYLRCILAIDENVGRLREHIAERGDHDETLAIYGADHGFFLGEHGWFDKRFMYEPSMRIPLVMAYPRRVPAGQDVRCMVSNLDVAQTILDAAGVEAPSRMQGVSLLPRITGLTDEDVRSALYYRFYEHDDHMHHVWAHYGIRTDRYKLIFYYADGLDLPNAGDVTYPPEWELFDLEVDPDELTNVYLDPQYREVRDQLQQRLLELQKEVGDEPYVRPTPAERAAKIGPR